MMFIDSYVIIILFYSIDNTRGDVAIDELFKDKYATLYNSVSSSSNSMKALHERIRVKLPVSAIHAQTLVCINIVYQ